MSCEGETVSDKELIGPMSYWPIPGFPGYFFPFENSEGYLSPLVAIHFERPASEWLIGIFFLNYLMIHYYLLNLFYLYSESIVINVLCKAWAKNIIHKKNGINGGSVHFELMMD